MYVIGDFKAIAWNMRCYSYKQFHNYNVELETHPISRSANEMHEIYW